MKKWTQIVTIVLVMAMFALVDIFGEKEIIFPEIAALAFGFWIMDKTPWEGTRTAIWASPTLAALTGVFLLRYAPFSLFFLIGSAFVLVVLQLQVLRSAVFPSISAAILPIITHTTNWLYPLSVCLLMAIIVLGSFSMETFDRRKNSACSSEKKNNQGKDKGILPDLIYWSKLLAGVLAVSALALRLHCLFMIAPPLIVGFVEFSRQNHSSRRTPGKILLLLVFAAFSGAMWFYLVSNIFHGPLWIFSGLSLLSVFLLYHCLQVSFPPAAAIALLPVLVPAANLWEYPINVLLGSSLFMLMGLFFFRGKPQGNTTTEKIGYQRDWHS